MTVAASSTLARGYWLLRADGAVFTHGALQFFGAAVTDHPPGTTFTSIVATVDGGGYWIVEDDGRIHAFGNANPVAPLDGAAAGVASVRGGAWVLSARGSVVALGEAPRPPVATELDGPVAGFAAARDGGGWVLRPDGQIHALGGVAALGSPADLGVCATEFVGIAPTQSGQGYWVCGRRGELFGFGDATFEGSPTGDGASLSDVVAIDATLRGGYVLVTARGAILPFGAIDPGPWPEVTVLPVDTTSIVDVALVAHPEQGPRPA